MYVFVFYPRNDTSLLARCARVITANFEDPDHNTHSIVQPCRVVSLEFGTPVENLLVYHEGKLTRRTNQERSFLENQAGKARKSTQLFDRDAIIYTRECARKGWRELVVNICDLSGSTMVGAGDTAWPSFSTPLPSFLVFFRSQVTYIVMLSQTIYLALNSQILQYRRLMDRPVSILNLNFKSSRASLECLHFGGGVTFARAFNRNYTSPCQLSAAVGPSNEVLNSVQRSLVQRSLHLPMCRPGDEVLISR